MTKAIKYVKYFTFNLFLLLFVVMISACSVSPGGSGLKPNEPNIIWDFSSVKLRISIVDEKGHSLIQPHNAACDARLRTIKMEWNGETYPYGGLNGRQLRALPEFYHGLTCEQSGSIYVLTFGEFQPLYGQKQILKLSIPGIKDYTIEFIHTVKTGLGTPQYQSKVWLDGNKVSSSNPFNITITINKEEWEKGYKDIRYNPVTLYFTNPNWFKMEPDHNEKDFSLTFRGKVYTLSSSFGTDNVDLGTIDAPLFYCGKSPFVHSALTPNQFMRGSYFLAFGPFDPLVRYHNEPIILRTKGNKEYKILFTSYIDPDSKELVYYASIEDNKESANNYTYFRNGPLVIL